MHELPLVFCLTRARGFKYLFCCWIGGAQWSPRAWRWLTAPHALLASAGRTFTAATAACAIMLLRVGHSPMSNEIVLSAVFRRSRWGAGLLLNRATPLW
ncbi:hypothetical protein KCP70_13885 [Salmonella enterica subsp. enterica]|nr:hypothetical protein KCP70_13885 [Salmonella enterica subsp. enterica]